VPGYFFHIVRGSRRIEDQDGVELPNLQAALEYAEEKASTLAIDDMYRKGLTGTVVIEIADDQGAILGTRQFPP
jgi:hypothetical protein